VKLGRCTLYAQARHRGYRLNKRSLKKPLILQLWRQWSTTGFAHTAKPASPPEWRLRYKVQEILNKKILLIYRVFFCSYYIFDDMQKKGRTCQYISCVHCPGIRKQFSILNLNFKPARV
jgi:hypothetical protein